MALSLRQIFAATPQDRFYRALRVKIEFLRFGTSKSMGIQKAICRSHSVDDEGRQSTQVKYLTMIEFHDHGNVKVACSCDDHLYRWEVALARKGASYITYSNGDRPTDTNPQMKPGTCKHVVALYNTLKQRRLLPKTHDASAKSAAKPKPKK